MVTQFEKRRVVGLIEQEFNSRLEKAQEDFSDVQIRDESDRVVSQERLGQKIAKLESLRSQVSQLEKSLSISLEKIANRFRKKKNYRNNCECHEDFRDLLSEIAVARLEQVRIKKSNPDQIRKTRRTLMAKAEMAASREELLHALKEAGLM